MNYFLIAGLVFFALLSAYLFYTGKIKEGIVSVFAGLGFLAALLPKSRPKELTPIQQLDAIKFKIDEAKKTGDAAVLATVPDPPDHTKSRKKRWEEL